MKVVNISRGLEYKIGNLGSPRFYSIIFENGSKVKICEDSDTQLFNKIDKLYMN